MMDKATQSNAGDPKPGHAHREHSSINQPVLVLGLDGATFDVLNPLMAEGRMPRLKEAVDSGVSGVLRSTTPPITPAAWTTFLTGKQPGSHGIIDFERYDVFTNRLSFNSTRCLNHVRNLWQILSDHGLKVGSVNVPMTYPPVPINGFLVSGFETPGTDSDFVYPPEIKADLLRRWPDPIFKTKWKRKTFGGERLFEENLSYMARSFHDGADMAISLGDRHGWDVLMVVFKLIDNLQHKTWKYIDPRWSHRNPRRRERVRQCFEEADRAIGKLHNYAKSHDANFMIVSDHGHGSLEGKVQPNLMLKRWGYLALRGRSARLATRAQHVLDRLRGKTRRFARTGQVEHDLAVDFASTKACVMHAGMAGFLYINLKGRQPTGIVSPDEYEALRDELRNRFLSTDCRCPGPGGESIQLFSEVHKPEELYACSREDQPWLPDLMLIPHESLAAVRKIRGRKAVRWLPFRRLEGTHRPEGILIASGPKVASGRIPQAHIVDCAPTILAMLGLGIPEDMEGRVITELFKEAPIVEKTEAPVRTPGTSTSAEPSYSSEELAKVTERLTDLGYLE